MQENYELNESTMDDSLELGQSRQFDLVYVYAYDASYGADLAQLMRLFNYEVLCFSDLEEFRAAILIRAPAAVVIDIDSEAGQRAKAALAVRVVTTFPSIYISAQDNFTDRLAAVRDGAEGYFIKPVDAQALSARIDEKIAKNTVRSYRILVVDDDEFFLSFFEAVLSSAGMHVKALIDPTEILIAIKKFKPELILTDLHMPQCSGIEMAKLIRQNNHYLDIPIVFLSSETEIDKQIGALETGADDFLTKPIDPGKLISSISARAERYRNLRQLV